MTLNDFIKELKEKKALDVNGVHIHVYNEDRDNMVIMGNRDYSRFINVLIFASTKTGRAYTVDKDELLKETGIDFIPSMAEIRAEMWEKIRSKASSLGKTVTDTELRLSSLELHKQRYLSEPDAVIDQLVKEIAA